MAGFIAAEKEYSCTCNERGCTMSQVNEPTEDSHTTNDIEKESSNNIPRALPPNIETTTTTQGQEFPFYLKIVTTDNALNENLFSENRLIEELNITSNMNTLNCHLFSPLKNLKNLIMRPEITEVINNDMNCLPNLESLELRENKLRFINRKISLGSNRMQRLDLSHNQIESIEDGSFDMPMLKTLLLNNNRLRVLSPILFANAPLEHIMLDGNDLVGTDFKWPKTLVRYKIDCRKC